MEEQPKVYSPDHETIKAFKAAEEKDPDLYEGLKLNTPKVKPFTYLRDNKLHLDMALIRKTVNRHLDTRRSGTPERVSFLQNKVGTIWMVTQEFGDDEQKAWVKKRLKKFSKKFGYTLTMLDEELPAKSEPQPTA